MHFIVVHQENTGVAHVLAVTLCLLRNAKFNMQLAVTKGQVCLNIATSGTSHHLLFGYVPIAIIPFTQVAFEEHDGITRWRGEGIRQRFSAGWLWAQW